MNQANLDRIETELQIKLPAAYRDFMLGEQGEEFSGNSDTDLWDDADAVISRNKDLRAGMDSGGSEPWPPELFFVGDPLTTCGNAIMLNDDRTPVHWIDHCDIEAESSGEVHPSFAEWASEVIENM
jgi:hypothetical protein